VNIQRQAVLTKTGEFPFAYWVLWGSILLDGLGKFVITFLGLYLVKDRQFSIEQTTLIISAYGLASIPSALLGGVLSDKIGHRNTVIVGFWGAALTLSLLGMVRQFEHIVIMSMCLGLVHRLNKPAITALVAEIVPPEKRKRAYHLNYWAVNLGAVFAMPVAGILANLNYQLLFVGDALTAFGAGVLLRLFFQHPFSGSMFAGTTTQAASQPVAMRSDRLLWGIVFGVFLFSCVYAQIDLGLPLDMQKKGISEAGFGTLLALNPLVIVLFQVPVAQLLNRFAHSSLLASGTLLLGFGFALHGWASTPLAYGIPIIIWTVGEMLFFPNALALVTEIAPTSRRARYQGIFYTAWASLRFLGASLGGILLHRWGASVLWGTCLGLALVATGIFLVMRSPIQAHMKNPV
jgi:MFS family permease